MEHKFLAVHYQLHSVKDGERTLEEQTIRKGRSLHDMTLAEMDAIWDEGKAKGL